MTYSQNATFSGPSHDDSPHPAGESLARMLSVSLGARAWDVDEPDNWRDVGWSFKCARKGAELAVNIASIGEDSWLLQVGPAVVPNVFARLVGKRPSATRAEYTDAAGRERDFGTRRALLDVSMVS